MIHNVVNDFGRINRHTAFKGVDSCTDHRFPYMKYSNIYSSAEEIYVTEICQQVVNLKYWRSVEDVAVTVENTRR